MKNSVERFSNRVANYVKYRPGYPPEVLKLFREEMGLRSDSVVVDIGSGTGISARLFLENGNTVYGVEPNAAMREAAEEYLAEFDNFLSIDGTAESTSLPDDFADFIIAAQAFHWFDPEETRSEFKRILEPGGYIALIWNERQLDSTEFLREYETLLLDWANDYERVRHENVDENILSGFFRAKFRRAVFPNRQVLDFEGLKGRVASSSYMPAPGDERFESMENTLRAVFEKHAENDRIEIFYDTRVFYTQV